MKRVSMRKINEVLRLHFKLGLSIRQSANATNTSRGSANNYCTRFKELAVDIDSYLSLNEIEQEKLFYPSIVLQHIAHSSAKVMPDYIYVHGELKKKHQTKVTLALLHEEYKETNPNNHYGYTQFREYYVRFLNQINPSMKQIHLCGEKMFVDYSGLTVNITNQKSGEITKAQIFVAVLGASGYTYVHATYSQKQRDFILSHTLAYDFFGGVPKIVVPDNLKSAVIKHSKKDGIVINESYAALARHYGMAVEPARPYKPKDKAKVELGVKGIQRWILAKLRHQTFFGIIELNDALSLLLDTYNNKIIKKFNKSRSELFLELDLPFLQPLPVNRYVYKEFKEATVASHYHIFLENCEYSVPYKYLGQRVQVWHSSTSVEMFHKGVQIAIHPKLHFAGQVSSLKEHMPKNHEYMYEKTNPQKYLNWANNIGINCFVWAQGVFNKSQFPPNAYRKLNAVLSLAKIYGNTELDLALEYATTHNIDATASVKSILDKRLYLGQSANNNLSTHYKTNNSNLFSNIESLNTHEYLRGNIYS